MGSVLLPAQEWSPITDRQLYARNGNATTRAVKVYFTQDVPLAYVHLVLLTLDGHQATLADIFVHAIQYAEETHSV